MKKEIKNNSMLKNYIFNLIKTFSSLVFPVATFAYSARVLGEEGIGRVNFAKSIVTYFITFAMLGMNYYGTREAAKLKNDRQALSKFSHEMLFINAITTILSYALLYLTVLSVRQLHSYSELLAVYSIGIVLQAMGMEWLYQALEEYRYIAVRSVIFQIISLMLLFLFVKEKSDVIPCVLINVMASSGAYILNFVNATRLIDFHCFRNYKIRKHLKPLLLFFFMVLSIELYAVLDSTMLGFLKGDIAVGKYTAAIKINKLTNQLIVAMGVVMLPRLSYSISRGENELVKKLVKKAYNYVFMISVPAMVGLFVLSDEIIYLFCGTEFTSASTTMKILTPIVLVIPFSMITNQFIFAALGKEKLILFSTGIGAMTNFLCNSVLIPQFAENGAAVATVVAESAVAIVCYSNVSRFFDTHQVFESYLQYWIAAIPIAIISAIVHMTKINYLIQIILIVSLSIGTYFSILIVLKNSYLINVIRRFRIK